MPSCLSVHFEKKNKLGLFKQAAPRVGQARSVQDGPDRTRCTPVSFVRWLGLHQKENRWYAWGVGGGVMSHEHAVLVLCMLGRHNHEVGDVLAVAARERSCPHLMQ